jgi:hypothetical protein
MTDSFAEKVKRGKCVTTGCNHDAERGSVVCEDCLNKMVETEIAVSNRRIADQLMRDSNPSSYSTDYSYYERDRVGKELMWLRNTPSWQTDARVRYLKDRYRIY